MSEELQSSGQGEAGGSEAAPAAPVILPPAPVPSSGNEGDIQWGDPEPAPVVTPEVAPPAATVEPPVPVEPPPAAPSDFTSSQLQNGTWELRTPTGNVFKGGSELEAYQAAARGKVEADRTIRELREKISAPPAAAPVVQPAPTTTPSEIDPADLLIADMQARGMGYKNAAEFRAVLDRAGNQLSESTSAAADYRAQTASVQFVQSTPDFLPTESNITRLDEGMTMLSRTAGLPDGQFLPVTVDNIRVAHYLVKGQGLYEAVKPEQIVPTTSTNRTASGQFAPRSNVMPMPPSPSAPTPRSKAPDPFSMSDEEWSAHVAQTRSA